MISDKHLQLFAKYRHAPTHAFSTGFVSETDKELYWELYEWLVFCTRKVSDQFEQFDVYSNRLSRDGGVQGQRPKDLWASIVNKNSEGFGRFPQIFVIANANGIEIGFSLAIHERDYFNADVKMRARAMIPSLYRKLPHHNSEIVSNIDSKINWSEWKSVVRHREGSDREFPNVSSLVRHHSSLRVDLKGGGSVYKEVPILSATARAFDLENELLEAVGIFEPLMLALSPSSADNNFVRNQIELDAHSETITAYAPEDEQEGRTFKLRKLAERLGQAKFRNQLIKAYNGMCAITGTQELTSLQAAHITPYDGAKSNKISNGILLRADIHNIFDRGLIYICPNTLRVVVSPTISCPTYRSLDGIAAILPTNPSVSPRVDYLMAQKERYNSIHNAS